MDISTSGSNRRDKIRTFMVVSVVLEAACPAWEVPSERLPISWDGPGALLGVVVSTAIPG